MPKQPGESGARRHDLSDWLALHGLDPQTCRRLLDDMAGKKAGELAARPEAHLDYQVPDLEQAWRKTLEAMRDFLPEQQAIIDDTFARTGRIAVDRPERSRKALTLDNGPGAYPTILFSYLGEPSDSLIMAHEFGHALQIRASRGKFVAPVLREVCAFLGEGALLAHVQRRDAALYPHLAQAWQEDDQRYFGIQRERLQADLSRPDTAYKYSWNYPISRFLALQIAERCSGEWIWNLFEGNASVPGVLQALDALRK